ncbi:hypothetical protein DENSPDRAFT_790015, partial [Dentipellis sp. KUC8613]
LDGNFKLVHMYMRRPENDVPLNDGLAFLVMSEWYKKHLETSKEPRQRSTCRSHRAVNQRNAKRKNLRATGIGAAACMHGCFVPHAVVDFHAGEQYNIPIAIVMYDIMCQYGVNFVTRVQEYQFLDLPFKVEVRKGIGLFHVHGHEEKCFARFAPSFGMAKSHRQEMIDDHMNDSNWKKCVGAGEFLSFSSVRSHRRRS